MSKFVGGRRSGTAAQRRLVVEALEDRTAPAFLGTFEFVAVDNPVSVAVGDFDGDGIPDLVTANAGSDNVSVLLGNGNGSFQAAQNFAAGDGPVSTAVGDFNGDGIRDLVTANRNSNNVSVPLLSP